MKYHTTHYNPSHEQQINYYFSFIHLVMLCFEFLDIHHTNKSQ